ncbi:MAG: metallophosphoesterase [Candidatus Sericytochromatia bacterium]|nr:metallophosphoesterase [Candidatus Sericytochromatia bacterium]
MLLTKAPLRLRDRLRKRRRMNWQNIPVEIVDIDIADLPLAFEGYEICQITDVHFGGTVGPRRLTRVVQQATALEADMYVLTGDYIEGHHGKYADPVMKLLGTLPGPIFGVLGNHDHWGGQRGAEDACDRHGIELLTNTHRMIELGDDKLCLAGVADLWCDEPDIVAAVAGVPDDVPRIVLSHNPEYVEDMAAERVDLMLSGHTHGGQVRLFGKEFSHGSYGRKYMKGLVDAGNTQVYISRGLGTSVVPFRIGVPPEISLIRLHRAPDKA